jgi:glycosyltransferase involved in cell wall biosynthesis
MAARALATSFHPSDILHAAWQLLPYGLRRRMLFAASSALAPAPHASARRIEPVFVVGFFTAASGLGELARLLYDAYVRLGVPVFGIDLTHAFRQGADVRFAFEDGRTHSGAGTVILAVNAPFVALALTILGRKFLAHKWRIGYWAWELPVLPTEWSRGAELVNEVWAISRFAAEAMERDLGRPVRVVLPPVRPRALAAVERRDGTDFVVLTAFNMASSFARKNPLAAVAAFKEAFAHDPGVLLIVKVARASVYPAGVRALEAAVRSHRNIKLLTDNCSVEPTGLLAGADAFLSLHRAEGLGLLFAHAMHMGKSIVATGWSGNLDILNSGNACLVPATLVPARDPQGTYQWPEMQWAEPSVPAADAFLRALRSRPAWRAQKERQAQADFKTLFDVGRMPMFGRVHATIPACAASRRTPS